MQANYISKIKIFLKKLFAKKEVTENKLYTEEDVKQVNDNLVATGFMKAPEHFTKRYKMKEPD